MTVRLSPFFTFEGIDGSGKSTVVQAVARHLADSGQRVWTTAEETDHFGPAIRRSIEERNDPLVTAHLFLADRFVHARAIRRHLQDGEVVLCDRYAHSTLAYQGVTLDGRIPDPVGWLRRLHEPLALWPDRVVWLDIDPEAAMRRVEGRGATAPYEKVAFLEKVRAQYAALAKEDARVVRVDAEQAPDAVARDAIAALSP